MMDKVNMDVNGFCYNNLIFLFFLIMASGHDCTASALLSSNLGAHVTLNCANVAVNILGSKEADLLVRAQCPLGDEWSTVADFDFFYTDEANGAGFWERELYAQSS